MTPEQEKMWDILKTPVKSLNDYDDWLTVDVFYQPFKPVEYIRLDFIITPNAND